MVRITLYYLCGVLAAAQIGKLATLAPPVQRELGIGLTAMALLIGLIEAGGALLGARAGRIAQRCGLARALTAAMLLLAAAGAAEALAPGMAVLTLARAVEAAGYLGVIVAAPVLVADAAGPRRAPLLLTVWSTFVPVGLAVGAWAHGALADTFGWRSAVGASALAALLMAAALVGARERQHAAPVPAGAAVPLGRAAWLLAAGFGAFALLSIGTLALLPTLLVERGLAVAAAGRWTAWASIANVPGSLAAALLLQRPKLLRPLVGLALMVAGVSGFLVFDGAAAPAAIGAAALLQNAALGVFGGLAFALLPQVAGGSARTAQAYGLLAQFGASGSLAGPPLLAAAAVAGGWPAVAWLGAGLAAAALGFALRALPAGASSPQRQSALP
jgi:MFS transporter, CP family, cyanate transporter